MPLDDLDSYDRAILRVLQTNARVSISRLSELVHLSPTAASQRLRRLQQSGIITGYQARLDPHKVGAAQAVFLQVTLDRSGPRLLQALLKAVNNLPECQDCYMMAGAFDVLLKLRVADMAACRSIIQASIQVLPGVRHVRVYSVISQLKESQLLV